ncbi:MAG TPA: hypothetical protein VEL06_02710 [Haliangiales bacterium]|nr:hypothetical protein [Haliangiales bacterium]
MRIDGVDHILGGQVLGLERGQVEVHRDHPGLAAIRPGHGRAQHRGQTDANLILSQIIELLLGQLRAAETVLQDGNGGGVVTDDQRRRLTRREQAQDGLGDGRDLRHAGIHRSARVEEHLDDAHAIVGVGLDVLDVVDRGGERAFVGVDNALLNFLRAQPGVLPDDTDDRYFNVRENIRGRSQQHKRRQQQQQERCNNKGVGATKRQLNNPHNSRAKMSGLLIAERNSGGGATGDAVPRTGATNAAVWHVWYL